MGDEAAKIDIKVKDGTRDADVQIEIEESASKGTIKVGRDKTALTGLKKGKDGKRVEGKTRHVLAGELTITITIDCDKDPAEIRIVATDKKGKTRKESTYTFTHAEQDRLVEFLSGAKIPDLAAYQPIQPGTSVASLAALGGVVLALGVGVGLYAIASGAPGRPAATPSAPTTVGPMDATPAVVVTAAPAATAPGPTATATPTATPSAAPAAAPSPSGAASRPSLAVHPRVVEVGKAGTTVFFTGSGFTSGGSVTKTFVRPDGSRFSFRTTADADGNVFADLTITSDQPAGTWTAVVTDDATGRKARVTFEVRS